MPSHSSSSEHHSRFDDDLVGLDPLDPEAQAFARHLDRIETCRPAFTVEASLQGIEDFAESSNRAGGGRWWIAAIIVALIITGVLAASWDIVVHAISWLSA